MQPSICHPLPSILAALLLLAGPTLGSTTAPPPENLSGEYDPETELFTLTWDWDANEPVDFFRVLLDGNLLGTTTTTSYDDDLDGYGGGIRTYTVAAFVDETQGDLSEEYNVAFSPGDPLLPCALLGTTVDPDDMPPLGVAPHPECLPSPSQSDGDG